MAKELFKPDEAFLSFDWGSQGISGRWTRPAINDVISVGVDFKEFSEYGLTGDGIIPPEYKGQAFQPVSLYFRAHERVVKRVRKEVGAAGMKMVKRIGIDGQQHGNTYWNEYAPAILSNLKKGVPLADQLGMALASFFSRIWMTSSSKEERKRMTEAFGGIEAYIKKAGCQPFGRYTGTVIADVKARQPLVLERTKGIRLVEQVPYMLMTGNFNAPLGWGGACGTALWDYKTKSWDEQLLRIALNEKEGETPTLLSMLPRIVAPGTSEQVSAFFAEIAGVPTDCKVYEPTGDNPGTRVAMKYIQKDSKLIVPSFFSIATSITGNLNLSEDNLDLTGKVALMYDYIGRPFGIVCKTNGTGRWDEVKKQHNVDHSEQDRILAHYLDSITSNYTSTRLPNAKLFFCYRKGETFPETNEFEWRNYEPNKESDVVAVIETSLADLAVHVGDLLAKDELICIAGGASKSRKILEMFAAMLNRPIVVGKESSEGACMGSNYAAQFFYLRGEGKPVELHQLVGTAETGEVIQPNPTLVRYYHKQGGYFSQFKREQQKLFAEHNK